MVGGDDDDDVDHDDVCCGRCVSVTERLCEQLVFRPRYEIETFVVSKH